MNEPYEGYNADLAAMKASAPSAKPDAATDAYAEPSGTVAEQGTPQWLMERVGCCTASMFEAVQDYTKAGKEGAKRRNYRVKLAVERLLNRPTDNYVNTAMEWGTDNEAGARMAYEAKTAEMVDEVGFIHHPDIAWCGGSPDGLIGEDGGLEIKCPFEPAVHAMTMLNKTCDHLPQIQGLMWITGRKWWDFVSYDPRMPHGLSLHVQRIERDEAYIANLAEEVQKFLGEVDELHQQFCAMTAAAS